ncbi:unnamed protein product [Heligmosomoides polygyrus]|uniref:Peptidase A1 domain-containing protein n=1 Tax=Heligmosomoides polygyrus TaxID=6339 RepID=A0A3P8CNY3_HELPZ|nr:unnamed protein product [Heligmosomoides polygyrus]
MNRVNASHIGVPRRYFTSKCHSGDIAVVEMEKPLPSAATNFNYACLPSLTTKLQQKIAMAGFGRNLLTGPLKDVTLKTLIYECLYLSHT